jgi:hypothetical protein
MQINYPNNQKEDSCREHLNFNGKSFYHKVQDFIDKELLIEIFTQVNLKYRYFYIEMKEAATINL